jgi:hypothetical protein
MLKDKYLYRKYRKYKDEYSSERHKKEKNIDLFSDLPFHQGMGKKYRNGYDLTPLIEFIESKIGYNWDDVYSEILTKIKNKHRMEIDHSIYGYIIENPIYDEDYVPRNKYGYIFNERLFIDMDNIVRKYTKYENISNAKKYMRREKIKRMLENRDENKEDDNEIGLFEG